MKLKAIPLFSNDAEPQDMSAFHAAMVTLERKASGYYIMLLGLPSVIWTMSVKTAATCGFYVYVNPLFFQVLDNHSQRAFVLGHEVAHIVLEHMPREKAYGLRGFFRKIWDAVKGALKKIPLVHKLWNKACDFVINADLVAHGLEAPKGVLLDTRFSRDMLADNVYMTLFEEQPDQPDQPESPDAPEGTPAPDGDNESGDGDPADDKSDTSDDDSGDDSDDDSGDQDSDDSDAPEGDDDADQGEGSGSGTDDTDDAPEGDSDGDPVPSDHDGHDEHFEPRYDGTAEEQAEAMEEDRGKIKEIVDDAIDGTQQARDRGESQAGTSSPFASAGYKHNGEGELSKVAWNVEFADIMTKAGRGGEQTFRRISPLKLKMMGVVAPTQKGKLNRMVWTVDVSGSVDRYMLGRATLLVAQAIDALAPTNGCLVLFTNTSVIGAHDVYSGADLLALDIPNCGGTRMMSAVQYLEDYGITDHDVHICFTDGDLPYGEYRELADNGVVIVLDHVPSTYKLERIKRSGIRYIVADDDMV